MDKLPLAEFNRAILIFSDIIMLCSGTSNGQALFGVELRIVLLFLFYRIIALHILSLFTFPTVVFPTVVFPTICVNQLP